MSMTKKDFEGIARAINSAVQADPSEPRVWAIETVANMVAAYCASTNPNFQRERFLKACGVKQ